MGYRRSRSSYRKRNCFTRIRPSSYRKRNLFSRTTTSSHRKRNLLTNSSCQKRNRNLLQPTTKERCIRPTIRPTLQPNPTKEGRFHPIFPTTTKNQNLWRKNLHSIIRKENLHSNSNLRR